MIKKLFNFYTCVFCFVVLFLFVQPSFSKEHIPQQLKVVNYNIQIWPFYGDVVNPPNNKELRTKLIPESLGHDYDIIFFNEIFDKDLRKQLTLEMTENYPYWVDVANNHDPIALSSGVMAFSKWPIERTDELKYTNCLNEECMAQKGALYVKIDKQGTFFHLFGTHTQSDNDSNAWKTRAKQMGELKEFINLQKILSDDPVIILGDLNIDSETQITHLYSEATAPIKEIDYVKSFLNLSFLQHTGLKYSFDYELNKMTALSSGNKGVREALDHIWILNGHREPNYASSTESYIRVIGNDSKMSSSPDLSDHFPVIGVLNYD